jgi:alpha-galactosidase
MGLEAIREAVGPDVTLLGCGCPIGSGIGIFDAMRIGADVDPGWSPAFAGIKPIFQDEPNMPGTCNALQNILTRAPFHNRWWVNDPDCLLIRPDSELTLPEVQSLATAIALSGGALLLSDDLPEVPPERLRIAEQLLPIIGDVPRVLDWFDEPMPRLLRLDLENVTGEWHLLAVFNWEDEAQDETLSLDRFDLPPGEYFTREFWSGASGVVSDGELTLKGIPPHGVRLIAMRPVLPNLPCYLGSDLHISQGLEISEWKVTPQNGISFSIQRSGKSQGEIDICLQRDPSQTLVDQKPVEWVDLGENLYRIPVRFTKSARIEIT